MLPAQHALLERLLEVAHAECLRSPTATLDAQHLRAVLLDHLLQAGCGVLEPTGEARVGRLLRMADDVVRAERVALPVRRAAGSGRPARAPDLRVWTPDRLDLELAARGGFWAPVPGAARALHDRLARLGAGATDALLLACDRRSYDALRRPPGAARDQGTPVRGAPSSLAALCEAVLPPSAALGASLAAHAVEVGRGQTWLAHGAVTPMVFGVQRVVVALVVRSGAGRGVTAAEPTAPAQLDVFGG